MTARGRVGKFFSKKTISDHKTIKFFTNKKAGSESLPNLSENESDELVDRAWLNVLDVVGIALRLQVSESLVDRLAGRPVEDSNHLVVRAVHLDDIRIPSESAVDGDTEDDEKQNREQTLHGSSFEYWPHCLILLVCIIPHNI